MLTADHYHGEAARTYEARRATRPPWPAEQAAVAALVTEGPVLDVPIGTGRYLSLYAGRGLAVTGVDVSADMLAEARGKDPAVTLQQGSIFALPFPAGTFGTAVCTRLLNWFLPEAMAAAVAELRRVARSVVLSIRTGFERPWTTYTHGRATALAALGGWTLTDETVLREEGEQGVYAMWKARPASWAQDVVPAFAWSGGAAKAQRLADEWAVRYGVPAQDYATVPVRAEWWDRSRLAATLAAMATVEPRLVAEHAPAVARPPKALDGPLVLLRWGTRYGMIDGRHRAHVRSRTEGLWPVLVLECSSS